MQQVSYKITHIKVSPCVCGGFVGIVTTRIGKISMILIVTFPNNLYIHRKNPVSEMVLFENNFRV